jgi:hypothetical protein
MTNIPLSQAVIMWDYQGNKADMPPIVVIAYDGDGNIYEVRKRDWPDYFSSWGADVAEYASATGDTHRMFLMLEKFRELVIAEGLDPKTVNEAFCVIPEWRVNLMWNGIGHTIPDHCRDEEAEEAVIKGGFMNQPQPAEA